jgi:hypothetical protein
MAMLNFIGAIFIDAFTNMVPMKDRAGTSAVK